MSDLGMPLGRLKRVYEMHERGASIGPCAVLFSDLVAVLAVVDAAKALDFQGTHSADLPGGWHEFNDALSALESPQQ